MGAVAWVIVMGNRRPTRPKLGCRVNSGKGILDTAARQLRAISVQYQARSRLLALKCRSSRILRTLTFATSYQHPFSVPTEANMNFIAQQSSTPELTNANSTHSSSSSQATLGQSNKSCSRRRFLAASSMALAAVHASSSVVKASNRREIVIGEGDHQYRVYHQWAKLPEDYTWQTTHNVAVDKAGNLYVIHEGRENQKDHPSIFVFDAAGKFVKAFGDQFQGGGHGIEVRAEGNQEFLYVAAYQKVKMIAKLTLDGEVVWQQRAPKESGKYASESYDSKAVWPKGSPREFFLPTNFAFLDDGGFLLADGYGAYYIHRFDAQGKWVSCFGGEGKGNGTFNTPHGLWIDSRGQQPVVVVTDRAHNSLQRFTLDGSYLGTLNDFKFPANVDSLGDLLLVAELKGGLSLLDKDYKPVAVLGEDSTRVASIQGIRGKEAEWQDGKFVHPHDACFAPDGSIFVAEWVERGRITKLEKI